MYRIELWTDGSCYNATKVGGWCAIILAREDEAPEEVVQEAVRYAAAFYKNGSTAKGQGVKARVVAGGTIGTTNNRMELQAIIEGIKALKPCTVKVITDSQYAITVLGNPEAIINCNGDLIKEWRKVSKGFRITWEHVRGHNGTWLNEQADKIAREEYNARRPAG